MKYVLTALLIFECCGVMCSFSQNHGLTHCPDYSLSPSESRANSFNTDISANRELRLSKHPVFHAIDNDLRRRDSADTDTTATHAQPLHSYQNIVLTGYSAGKAEGDFLPYEGNGSYDWRLYGHGSHNYGKAGTLSGTVAYARGKHRNIGWSTTRFPDLYWPFILTDTTGGNSQFETYDIEGQYGVNLGSIWLGASAKFKGEQAHRMTDPRLLNNTTFLQFGLDLGYVTPKGQQLMLGGGYLRNKQYEHDRYWRPGEQQRFFVVHGFGLYDNKESGVFMGTSRMHYLNGFLTDFSYTSPVQKKVCVTANIGYQRNKLTVEENKYYDLYASTTSVFTPQLHFKWQCGKTISIHLLSEHELMKRLGYERVFERYMTNIAKSTYDYRQIAEYQNYKLTTQQGANALRAEFALGRHSTFGLQGGANYLHRNEQNTFYHFEVDNLNVMPYGRADYKLTKKKFEFSTSVQSGIQSVRNHTYDVDITASSISHLDFQTCFAPYAYYAAEYTQTVAEISYTYFLKKCGIGAKVKYMNITGERLKDVGFDKPVGYYAACPMIQTMPDKHNEQWFNVSTFVIF